ncbi:GtrA family protein [Erwinia sp. S63]|uniref:GtrA family protein n=1 Tax=Erwinia sp. S63 TaxID=2769341 RepID=UPI00190A0F33|nr:GtrA family protein [Erwinia sp. S63]MBK0094587.1 GtrA family protein [Erwinia sp. S63]
MISIVTLKKIFLFGMVGVLGFLVDAVMLYLLKSFTGVYIGRLFSFSSAVVVTWICNRNVTFDKNNVEIGLLPEFIKYFSLMIVGGVINLSLYYLLISSVQSLQEKPIVAVAVGCLAGMMANFLTSRYFLYKE